MVNSNNAHDMYVDARKKGRWEYSRNISKGHSGHLPFLEGVLKNIEIVTESDLGTVDIPLNKIVGTYTYARSRSFASNFMPVLSPRTEFGQKWINLCNIHNMEGIRDPIKVYEYLNWFYVIEGNKRVSVLKYFDAYSIPGSVARLIPKRDENDINIAIYYEFLDFYRKTGINVVWFTRRNSFSKLLGYILKGLNLIPCYFQISINILQNSIYLPFRKIYHELGGAEASDNHSRCISGIHQGLRHAG